MKKIFVPVILCSSILGAGVLLAGCSNQGHDNTDGHHKLMSDHHGEIKSGAVNKHHETNMDEHHTNTTQSSHHDMGFSNEHGMQHGGSLAGKPGKEGDVSRSINIEAADNMRFSHEPFNIKDGETIKFIVTNKGAIAHEFSIGTKVEHQAHGKMMASNPNMHHGPGGASITIKPGTTETLIWSFDKTVEVELACNIPGHYQAGMLSSVKFVE